MFSRKIMTIRKKISRTFALLTAIILISLSIAVYFFSYIYTKRDFNYRLKERINITAEYFLIDDDVNSKLLEEIKRNFLRTLPHENEYLIPQYGIAQAADFPDSIRAVFDDHFLNEILDKGYSETGIGVFSAVGITYADKHGDFIIIVSAYDLNGFAKLDNLRNVLIFITLFYIIFTYFIGNWYSKQTLMPIAKIIDKVNEIGVSKINTRLERQEEEDEIGDLITTFNEMLDRLENSIAAQNNFISNASHELKNPLTAILGSVEISLSKERTAQEYKDFLTKIAKDASRLETLTLRLLRLAQTSMDDEMGHKEAVRIDELLIDLKNDFAAGHPHGEFVLDLGDMPEDPDSLNVFANEELLKICLSQFVDNSFKFSELPKVEIKMRVLETSVRLIISDDGVGIPKDEQAEIFAPFFRATNVRKFKGFGIGLPMAKRILDSHQATISVDSAANKGTIFFIEFPLYRPQESQEV